MAIREYDILAIGSGSAVGVVDAWLRTHPQGRGALIDKDQPGGICLTRGCIPRRCSRASPMWFARSNARKSSG